jgi:hypothetical protein
MLCACSLSATAQNILVAGVERPAQCDTLTGQLITKLKGIGYPQNWTIVVACTRSAWDQLRSRANALHTITAFTNLEQRLTVINGEILRRPFPLPGTSHKNARDILRHEHGHILCACGDELRADKIEGLVK